MQLSKVEVTIVMPIYNGASTLSAVFECLDKQINKDLVHQIVMIDDNSSDDSLEMMKKYAKKSSYVCRIISHSISRGLAYGYNEGAKLSITPYVITMHQDMLLGDAHSFAKIIAPLKNDARVVASYPIILHPLKVWKKYDFWQKAMFSRHVGKEMPMLTGKFDCFNKQYLESIEYFDRTTFRTAGEDGDIKCKIKRDEMLAMNSGLKVTHLHNLESNFGVYKYIKKEAQIAEAQGVLLRKYGPQSTLNFLAAFFRQLLVVSLLIPFVNLLGLTLIALYSVAYCRLLYIDHPFDRRIVALPFVNIFNLFVATYCSALGFIRNRQRI